ncbi:unnamed protein product [Prunus armeniaca]|uniref:Uncharacterized protein n=1 Tax=Prunus armeniaca TaxID=36596 RepID=A0A6J5W609_PRUAR|nr:unnamed protein product [Prunus armeniaca]
MLLLNLCFFFSLIAQPPQPSQPSFGSWIIQTLTPSWVSDITLFRQTDGEEIVSKRNTLLGVTTVVGALVFGMGVNPPAEYCKCFKEKHKVCSCTIAIYLWEFIMSKALVTYLLVIKFRVGQCPIRQFINLLLLYLLIGYWCILTTFLRLKLWVIMLCLCCVPAIFSLSVRRYIDQAVEGNGGVLGVGIEAGARHNVAIEASAGGGIEEGAGQNVVVEASAGGGIGLLSIGLSC